MSVFIDYFVPPHAPLFGIKPQNITKQLHLENWHSKAIILQRERNSHYVYIAKAVPNRQHRGFCSVNIFDMKEKITVNHKNFSRVDEAIEYVKQLGVPQ